MDKLKLSFLSILVFGVLVLLPKIVFADSLNKFYQLSLIYNNGDIQLKNISVLPGDISQAPQEGNFKIELVSFSNSILYKSSFDIPSSVHGEEFNFTTGAITKSLQADLSTVDFVLNVPYFSNGKQINIYNANGSRSLEVMVLQFAKTCGDNICQPQENYELCPQDCPPPIKDKTYCNSTKGSNNPACKTLKSKLNANLPLVAGGVIIILVAATLIYWRIKKSREFTEE